MIFDIIVIVVLLISALHAFWRGFIREVLTIFGALGGVFAAITFGGAIRPTMDGWLGVETGEKAAKLFDLIPMTLVSAALSYGLIFIVVFGVLSIISHLIAESARALGLGAIDRTLGVVFGLVRGLLILGIFYLPVHIVMDDDAKKSWFADSKTQMYIEVVARWLEGILPDNMLLKDNTPSDTAPPLRESLQNQNVLKSGNPPEPTAQTQPTPEQGYGDKARQTLDTLIEKGIEKGVEHLNQ